MILINSPAFHRLAETNDLVIGQPGSEKLAMMLIPISPHPRIVGRGPEAYAMVPIWRGLFAEALGTALLVILVLTLLERRSVNAPAAWSFPIALAFGVTMLVYITAPQTMTSLNPARDLGPRILLLLYGFGGIAFPGVRNGARSGRWWSDRSSAVWSEGSSSTSS